jgi:hypothetical protein
MSLIDMMQRHPLSPTALHAATAFRSTAWSMLLGTNMRRWPSSMKAFTSLPIPQRLLYAA